MALTAKNAREDLASLISDANLDNLEGPALAYEPRPGDFPSPYVTCFADGATEDGQFYKIRLRLYTKAESDVQQAQDLLDDLADDIDESVLNVQSAYWAMGRQVSYLPASDLFMCEWTLQVSRGT